MGRWVAFWVLVGLGAGCAPAVEDLKANPAPADTGGISFASAGSLVRSADRSRLVAGDPVTLSGELAFPSAGAGPFPAVILAHGCGGVGRAERGWAPVLRGWGYATLIIDSFQGRGLTEVCTRTGVLTGTQRIPDAYGALRALVTHPAIDRGRVALMGFSHGGVLTLGASTAWAKETYAGPGQPAFRAFLAFYPSCSLAHPERERVSAPLRIHAGELDDWTPAGPCIRLAERLRASGQDVTMTVYPGAHHAFDSIGRSFRRRPDVSSVGDCTFTIASILGPGPAPGDVARCRRTEATVAWNPEATEQARRNVQAELAELLK